MKTIKHGFRLHYLYVLFDIIVIFSLFSNRSKKLIILIIIC